MLEKRKPGLSSERLSGPQHPRRGTSSLGDKSAMEGQWEQWCSVGHNSVTARENKMNGLKCCHRKHVEKRELEVELSLSHWRNSKKNIN